MNLTSSLFTMSPINKHFGGTQALKNASLSINKGEIVGLIGRNGCGKSTLIKHLSGYHTPDESGWIQIAGRREKLPVNPDSARTLGLSFVHQDLGLLKDASIVDNLRLGRFATAAGGRIKWKQEIEGARRALQEFDLDVDPLQSLGELSTVEQAIVALVRSFMDLQNLEGGVLVLDEPTAFLAPDDVATLFKAMRSFAAKGAGLLLVSHRLDEVMDITDRVVVMRDGEMKADVVTSETTEAELVTLLLGKAIENYYPDAPSAIASTDVALSVKNLEAPGLHGVNFTVNAGEIIGLTGLRAMGFEKIPYALFGAQPADSGTMHLAGEAVEVSALTPRQAMDLGIAMLPSDRKRASGAQGFKLHENISLPVLNQYFRNGFIDRKAELATAAELVTRFGVKTASADAVLSELSGGNQQKALLAKWFQMRPKVLILHEPTAGVDIGAKKDLFKHIADLAESGTAVIMVSEEFADLANLCHRVLTFHDGHINPTAITGSGLNEGAILAQCYRGVERHAS